MNNLDKAMVRRAFPHLDLSEMRLVKVGSGFEGYAFPVDNNPLKTRIVTFQKFVWIGKHRVRTIKVAYDRESNTIIYQATISIKKN